MRYPYAVCRALQAWSSQLQILVATVSSLMHGEYGIEDVCLSVLCLVGPDGVQGKVPMRLTDEEVAKLQSSANKLKEVIAQLGYLINKPHGGLSRGVSFKRHRAALVFPPDRQGGNTMKYSYYPGCTLKNKAQDLDRYARASAESCWDLNWKRSASGSAAAGSIRWEPTRSPRKLCLRPRAQRRKGEGPGSWSRSALPVITCSSGVNDDMKNVEDIRTRANNYMALDEPYDRRDELYSTISRCSATVVGFDEAEKESGTNPLTGKKIGAYYGCLLLLRPGKLHGLRRSGESEDPGRLYPCHRRRAGGLSVPQ